MKKIDDVANLWEKTKDPKYKNLWYEEIMQNIKLLGNLDCFEMCDILRLELTGYVDTLNLHIMKNGSGTMIGCVCR